MSTEIATIQGTCHVPAGGFNVKHNEAFLSITRFYNGKDRGINIQLTVSQNGDYGVSYIHLTKEQCEELANVLLNCFNQEIYPSE